MSHVEQFVIESETTELEGCAAVLGVGLVGNTPVVWALIDDWGESAVELVGVRNGQEAPDGGRYVDTLLLGWPGPLHLFAVGEVGEEDEADDDDDEDDDPDGDPEDPPVASPARVEP